MHKLKLCFKASILASSTLLLLAYALPLPSNNLVTTAKFESPGYKINLVQAKQGSRELRKARIARLKAMAVLASSKKLSLREVQNFYGQEFLGIDSSLIDSIIEIESGGNHLARSSKGAIGLMQIVPKWHRVRCGIKLDNELFDPQVNMACGTKIISYYYNQTGSIFL